MSHARSGTESRERKENPILQSEVTVSAHTKSLQVLLGESESDDG